MDTRVIPPRRWGGRWHELNTWLYACDLCTGSASNPVALTCGHLFCSLCLDDAFVDGLAWQRNVCPICRAELPEETAQNFPIVESVSSAGPTSARRTIVSDAAASAGNNITMTGPVAAADLRSSVLSEARMAVVQDRIEEEIERTHTRQVNLIRHSSYLRAQGMQSLERAFDTMVRMNEDLLREMEDRDEDNRRLRREMEDRAEENRRLRRRFGELEITASASNSALGMSSVRQRRLRGITPIATHRPFGNVTTEEQPNIPEFVEGGSSFMNSEARD